MNLRLCTSFHAIQLLSRKTPPPLIELRPQLRQPTYGNITQGTVFSCGFALRYNGCEVFGLTITARCDLAQQKYPVLNYVPLVKLSDWLYRDGIDILICNELNDQSGKLKHFFAQSKLSNSLLASIPLERIAEVHFPLNTGTRAQRKTAQAFHHHVCTHKEFRNMTESSRPNSPYPWFCTHRKKQVEDLVRRLSRHTVLGHYFLERIDPAELSPTAYVCLLREVATLPRVVAEQLGRGLSEQKYEELCSLQKSTNLSFQANDLAMPICEIGSPTLEHILQSFAQLFGRVGIADPNERDISVIVEQILTCEGETTE